MNNIKKYLIGIFISVMVFMPSVVFAETTQVRTYRSDIYSEKNPMLLSFSVDKYEIDFGDKLEFPFYFQFSTGGSYKYGKYMISVNEDENIVTFKKIAASSSLSSFKVTPHKKTEGYNYVQPGAVYNDSFKKTSFKTPLYKIESEFTFDGNKCIETVLGNSSQRKSDSNTYSAHERVFVFCATGLSESECIELSSGQQSSKATVVVREKFGKFIQNDKITKYIANGAKSIKNVMSDAKETYTFDGDTSKVVYAFYGVTSEVLNDNETNSIEEVMTKLLLSLGSVFRGVVTAVGGSSLTIDALVFNQYEDTIVDFWGGEGTYVGTFTSVINGWHAAFQKWTAMVLGILLIAVGIRVLLLAGTPGQKKIQGIVVGWVMAVALLYLGPYFMKYAISINDAFVDILRSQSKYSIYSVYNSDFLNDLNLNYKMQLGEDSETLTLEETLMNLYGEIEEDIEANEDRMAELSEKLNKAESGLRGWLTGDAMIQETSEDGSVKRERTVAQVKSLIRSRVRSGATPEEIEQYINKIACNVRWTGLFNGNTNDILTNLMDYGTSYAEIKQLEKALKATEIAISIASRGVDLESNMKARAGETYRLVYVAVWYVMIYQLVVLLFLYYKRLITIGVLIIIYPLAVMMYAIEKVMGIEKSRTMKTWLSEYLVNVFVQSVHALVYIMLVEAGLRIFEEDEDNWLFFLFAVMAIFPMESVIKSILGMKASSISDANKTLTPEQLLAGAIAAKSVVNVAGSAEKTGERFDAKQIEIDKKNASSDKTKELLRKTKDRVTMKTHGDKAEAAQLIAERNKRREKADEKTARKRAIAKKNREKRKKIAMATQGVRNAAAAISAITTAGALGFDVEDFNVGFSTAGYISGKKFEKSKNKNNTSSSSSSSSSSGLPRVGARYANNSNTSGGNTGSNRAAEQAKKATTENKNSESDSQKSTLSSKIARAASQKYQNQFRQKLADKMYADTDVHAGTPSYTITENNDVNE